MMNVKNVDRTIKKYSRCFVYILFFAAAFYIAYQTPYCHDEWKWGSPERIELMKQGFPNYNGRYLGNILSLIIVRSKFAKTLIMSGGLTWLLYVMDLNLNGRRNAEKRTKGLPIVLLLLAVILLWTLPQTLYAQSYGWSAAFVNFVPPVILFLIYYNWTETLVRDPAGTGELPSRRQILLAFPLGAATQLFSEHITIFALMYAVFVLILSWIKQKKPGWMHLSYLAGTVIGAVIMFTNGAYRRAASTPNSYKHIGFSVRTMYEQFSTTIMENLFLNNRVLNLLFAVVLIGLLIHRGKKRFTGFAACVLCGFSFYSIWMLICPGWIFAGNEMLNSLIQTLLCILYFLTVLFVIWETVSKEVRYSVCVLYLSAAVVTAPLLAASPIGPRCFYISYILECMALLKLVQYLFDEKNIDCYYPTVILSVLALLIGIVYVRMFSMIGAADQSRAAIIEAAVNNGETEITLPVLPYAGYYWTTIPQTEEWEVYFKQFYGIPQEVKLNFE